MNTLINPVIFAHLAALGKTPAGVRTLDPQTVVANLKKNGIQVSEEAVRANQQLVAQVMEKAIQNNEALHQKVSQNRSRLQGPEGKKLGPANPLNVAQQGKHFPAVLAHKIERKLDPRSKILGFQVKVQVKPGWYLEFSFPKVNAQEKTITVRGYSRKRSTGIKTSSATHVDEFVDAKQWKFVVFVDDQILGVVEPE